MKIIDVKIKEINVNEYVFKVKDKEGKVRNTNGKYYLIENNKRTSGMFNDLFTCIHKFIKKEKIIIN